MTSRGNLIESFSFGQRTLPDKHHLYEIGKISRRARGRDCFCSVRLSLPSRNKVFDDKFENEASAWYILAKGVFCSVALAALSRILDAIIAKLGDYPLVHFIALPFQCCDGRIRRKIWNP